MIAYKTAAVADRGAILRSRGLSLTLPRIYIYPLFSYYSCFFHPRPRVFHRDNFAGNVFRRRPIVEIPERFLPSLAARESLVVTGACQVRNGLNDRCDSRESPCAVNDV